MGETLIGGALALLGVVVALLIDLIRDKRGVSATRAARRWDVEYESLRQLSDLLPTFRGMQSADLERRKDQAVALAFRVRDNRVRLEVEPMMAMVVGSQDWNDQLGNAIRKVGEVMRDL